MKKLSHILLLALFALGACTEQPDAPVTPLSRPAGMEILSVTDSSVSVRWNYVEAANLYRWTVVGESFSSEGTTDACSATVIGLPSSTTLTFKVRSERGGQETGRLELSEWLEAEFTTLKATPPPPPVTHTRKAVFIGDSITRLWPQTDEAFFLGHEYMGKGIDGQTSKTIAARFKKDVVDNDPYVVHIMCGINDVAENDGAYVESRAILANIQKMAEMAEAAKIKVVVGSLTPCNKIWWWADDWKPSKEGVTVVSHILEANSLIKAWCEEKGYPFVDYYTPMVDEDGGFPEPYAYDGVHPQLQGFKVMDALVQPVLEELLKDVNL
ncbi:MAG: hypothetical protein J5748_07335 [Bacteroidales bacterium]|nr:hypothetical protein [Bacteroidales bacterium]